MLSVPDKLLLVAYELETSGKQPFSAEDLVIRAWQKFPDAFGLAGYSNNDGRLSYPDSNRVFAEIMGSKSIRKRGLLIKVGRKMYQLTEAGRDHARVLLTRPDKSSVEKAGLAREIEEALKMLFGSKAVEKIRAKRVADITFHDACAFWRISPRSSPIELEGRIANLLHILEAARRGFKKKGVTFEHGGRTYNETDLDTLLETHNELLRKFDEEIKMIKKRDEKKNTL